MQQITLIKERFVKVFLEMAQSTASLSHARKKKVGAVLIRDNRLIAHGCNGTVSGSDNCCEDEYTEYTYHCENENCKDYNKLLDESDSGNFCMCCDSNIGCYSETKLKTKETVIHAEENVLLQCAKNGTKTDGTILLVTHSPCERCARMIAQAGIKTVYFNELHDDGEGLVRLFENGLTIVPTSEEGEKFIKERLEQLNAK